MANTSTGRHRYSNFQSFIKSTTPSFLIPETCFQDSNIFLSNGVKKYYVLGEFWRSFQEWSAYGAGVPIRLNNGETVKQYYVPYLSAIQIYTRSVSTYRMAIDGTESDSCIVGSENEKLCRRLDSLSVEYVAKHEGPFLSNGNTKNHLYFQYFETCSPYGRIPLADKVNELAQSYPGLKTFKSLELSLCSWMSVAWYPIYHIPTKTNIKELSACFLTFHNLASYCQDNAINGMKRRAHGASTETNGTDSNEASNCISFPPFGLATYKLHGIFWVNPEAGDQERIASLFKGADTWLKQNQIQHHDFTYFSTHS